jgi:hypothetical protein
MSKRPKVKSFNKKKYKRPKKDSAGQTAKKDRSGKKVPVYHHYTTLLRECFPSIPLDDLRKHSRHFPIHSEPVRILEDTNIGIIETESGEVWLAPRKESWVMAPPMGDSVGLGDRTYPGQEYMPQEGMMRKLVPLAETKDEHGVTREIPAAFPAYLRK